MSNFAFIIHPLEISDIYKVVPSARFLPDRLIRTALHYLRPLKVSTVRISNTQTGKSIEGHLILCPLLPQQMLSLDSSIVIEKILAAADLGIQLGAKIVGLGAYTSVIGDKGITIANKLEIPVTTGNSLTVGMVVESCKKAAINKGIDISNATIAVIGATGSIGSAVCKLFSELGAHIILCAPNLKKLSNQKNELIEFSNNINVKIEEYPKNAVKDADIIVTASSSPNKILEFVNFKKNSIVCDVSAPSNISNEGKNERSDVLYFKGGLASTNGYEVKLGIDIGLPANVVYACMAETMVLSLEQKYIDYSLGSNLDITKIKEIVVLSKKHGFYAI